jgi:hypothetical protein
LIGFATGAENTAWRWWRDGLVEGTASRMAALRGQLDFVIRPLRNQVLGDPLNQHKSS